MTRVSSKAIERGKRRVFKVFEITGPNAYLNYRSIEIRAGMLAPRCRAYKKTWAHRYCRALVDEGVLVREKRKNGRYYFRLTSYGRKLRKLVLSRRAR